MFLCSGKEDRNMKKWKHMSEDTRKTISSCISHNKKLIEISKLVGYDPRAISKEVKRNRKPVDYIDQTESKYPKLNRWPYVCTNCKNRYRDCPFVKFIYDSKIAQRNADANLITSRKGIDLDADEFHTLDAIIKKGVDENKSIYQIKIENKDTIHQSISTLYRYINNGYLKTKRMDLPYAVTYKKRKHNKKYEYSNNNIDRSNHTYLDFLSYLHETPTQNVWQLDFLGSMKTDSKNILTFMLPIVHFTLLDIIDQPNSKKGVQFFDDLERAIGTEAFMDLIPVILTDRDPCFNDIEGICFSKITGEERCKLFFCDPYVSNQKTHVENMNKQLRKFFQKHRSIDHHTKNTVRKHNITLLNTPIKSLDGYTPKDAFIAVYGEDLFHKIFGIVKDERK